MDVQDIELDVTIVYGIDYLTDTIYVLHLKP